MDTIKYEIFLNSVETGSISAAAEKMGYTQPGASHMLNSLENELGIKLISRNKNGVKLTTAGKALLPYIKNVVSENNSLMQAASEISGLLKGCIVIGSMDTVSIAYLPKIINEFKDLYPNIEFDLKNGSYTDNEYWLLHKDVDCGFVMLPTSGSFNTVPVIKDRFVIVSGKGYSPGFANPHAVTKEELLKEKIVLIDGIDAYETTKIFSSDTKKLQVSITTKNTFSFIKMMHNNLGIGIIPSTLANEFSSMLNIYEFDKTYDRTIALAYLNKKEASPVTKKFIEFLESRSVL